MATFYIFSNIAFYIHYRTNSKKKSVGKAKCLMIIMLFFYLITVYTSTVLARKQIMEDIILLQPFLSWKKAVSGDRYRMKLVIENIIMLLPIGVVMPLIDKKKYYVIRTIFLGALFSLFIEVSQLVRQVGFFEIDDIINNTLGVVIGCIIISVIKQTLKQLIQRKRRLLR